MHILIKSFVILYINYACYNDDDDDDFYFIYL